MRRIFIANWKMQLSHDEAISLAKEMAKKFGKGLPDRDIVVAPDQTAICEVGKALKGTEIMLGAQDSFWEEKGAFTGEVSPAELRNLGCLYVIVGHSERRQKLGETDEVVAKKLRAVLKDGMTPILCVGETQAERDAGETEKILERELTSALSGVKLGNTELVIAYEPIWAIGTGNAAEPKDVRAEHGLIRKTTEEILGGDAEKVRIIYGGSVSGANMKEFLAEPDVSGALVGGASLKADEFLKIIKS